VRRERFAILVWLGLYEKYQGGIQGGEKGAIAPPPLGQKKGKRRERKKKRKKERKIHSCEN